MVDDIEGQLKAEPEANRDSSPATQQLLEFGLKYFGQYCDAPPSKLHWELCDELERILRSPHTERLACAAPRGSAKTTWVALIFLTFCIVHRLRRFPVLITSSAALAEGLIRDLKQALEDNELLAADFPHACGRGSLWRDREIVTANGVRVLALGAGQRIRGRRHHEFRPDLFVLDDLETDEQVRSPEQRDKVWDWLNKAVLKAKSVARKADFIAIGTILHFDSVLARLLDPRKAPGWRGLKYKSVMKKSDRQDLWDRWEDLYTDWHKPDEARLAAANAFFSAHKVEMLAGTEVLWPEVESYYDLMKLRIDEGPTSFDSEKQNEPVDPSSCQFQEGWFDWFDELRGGDGEIWLVPQKGDRVRLSDCDVYGATDPSMGKLDRHRDPSAIVSVAAYPSRRIRGSGPYQLYFVVDADIRRRHPHQILDDILRLHRLRRYQRHAVEAVQFQELFADLVREAIRKDPDAARLNIVNVKPLGDKKLRIQTLSPLIYTGQLRFNRKLSALYDQLRYFPLADHDDGPDALAMCMDLITTPPGWTVLYDSPRARASQEKLSPYAQQLHEAIPWAFEEREFTCGQCAHAQTKEDGKLLCDLRRVFVKADMVECEFFDPGVIRFR